MITRIAWPLEPEAKQRDIGAVLKTKTLKLKQEHLEQLPGGVHGAAIELAGSTDSHDWIVKVAPFLAEPDHLFLSAELRFRPPDEIENESEMLREFIRQTYDFLVDDVVGFAGSFMP